MKNLIACNIICKADRTPSFIRLVLLNQTTDKCPPSSPVSQLSATPWIQISINFLLKQTKRPGNYALCSSVHKQDEATDQLEGIEDQVEDLLCLNIGKVSRAQSSFQIRPLCINFFSKLSLTSAASCSRMRYESLMEMRLWIFSCRAKVSMPKKATMKQVKMLAKATSLLLTKLVIVHTIPNMKPTVA